MENIEIPENMLFLKDEIVKAFNSPMFFAIDNELVNLYEQLSRMNPDELQNSQKCVESYKTNVVVKI